MKLVSGVLILGLGLALVGCNKEGGAAKDLELKTDDQKTFYSVGYMFGGRLKELNLTDEEMGYLIMGLRHSAKGVKEAVAVNDYQMKMQELFRKRMEDATGKNKTSGAAFIEKFIKDEGASKTASGLAYKVLTPGEGEVPLATDSVEVHYHGTLTDGTVFDSSKERGKSVTFPLNQVIKGWTEGLQLVKPGGKVKLVIPSDLAYGDHGAPPRIPGGATLVFEVELIKIEKAKAGDAKAPAAPAAPKTK